MAEIRSKFERTDGEIFFAKPFEVGFGEEKYKFNVLPAEPMDEYRDLLVKTTAEIHKEIRKDATSDPEALARGLAFTFCVFPKKLRDLVKAYDPKQPWDEIRKVATDEQYARAFQQIVAVAFPFEKEWALMNQVAGANEAFRRLVNTTN
jgi:hypothetical protein